jgi:MFS family permease
MVPYYVLSAVIFLTYLATGTTSPYLPLYAQSLGASLVDVAAIVGGFSTVNLIAGLFWGRASDRLGRRKPFLVGALAALAGVNLLASFATDWWMLLALRLVEGAAVGASGVASLALMGDILDGNPRRARLVGYYRMSASLAFAIAIAVAGFVAERLGFGVTYRIAAGIDLAAFLIALKLREPAERRTTAGRDLSFGSLLRGPLLPLLVIAASFGLPFAAVYSVWPIWIAESLGLGRAVFGRLWGLAAFVEVPCMALAGYVTDRLGYRPTFIAGLTLFAGVFGLYLAAPAIAAPLGVATLDVLVAAQVVRGFAYAAFTATALTMAIEVAPADARGRASGLFGTAQSLAQIVGSYAGGPLATAAGYRTLFAAAAGVILLGAGYAGVALRKTTGAARPERA